MTVETETIKRIYERFGDDESRYIFQNRLMCSLTGDISYVFNIVKTTEEGRIVDAFFSSQKRMLIFGAGWWGKNIAKTFSNVRFDAFVDNDPNKKECEGLPVISFGECLENYKDALIVISSRLHYKEIHAQLDKSGIEEERILDFGAFEDRLTGRSYFDLPALEKARCPREFFIDAGAFDGATTLAFKNWAKDSYEGVYVFEPDAENIAKLNKNLNSLLVTGGGAAVYCRFVEQVRDASFYTRRRSAFKSVGGGRLERCAQRKHKHA